MGHDEPDPGRVLVLKDQICRFPLCFCMVCPDPWNKHRRKYDVLRRRLSHVVPLFPQYPPWSIYRSVPCLGSLPLEDYDIRSKI